MIKELIQTLVKPKTHDESTGPMTGAIVGTDGRPLQKGTPEIKLYSNVTGIPVSDILINNSKSRVIRKI